MQFVTGKKWFCPFVLLVGVCILAYSNSLQNKFMLDDDVVLFGEKGIENKSLWGLFTDYQWDFYRPVGHVFLWICYQLFGANVVGYHSANLFLFVVMVGLVWVMVNVLTGDKPLALLTSLLYAVHPINNMIVNYVTASVLGTFVICLEISFILFVVSCKDSERRSGAGLYYGSLLFFVLGLLSHEMSFIFPLFIVGVLYFIKGEGWKNILRLSWPYFAMAFVYLIFRLNYFSLHKTMEGTAEILPQLGVYLASLQALVVWYLGKLFWPQGIIFLWTGDIVFAPWWEEMLKIIGIVAILVYLIFYRWRKGVNPWALSLWAIGFVPLGLAGFAYFSYSLLIIEPHWFYFTSIGFFLLMANGLLALKKRIPLVLWIVLLASVLGSSLFCLRQSNTYWRDQETYSRYWLSLNTKNMTPYYGLGKSFLEKGRYREAIDYFEQGLKSVEYYNAFILADLGYAEFLAGETGKAQKYYQAAVELDPTYSVIYHYWGQLYLREGNYGEAEHCYQKALQLYPKSNAYPKALAFIRTQQSATKE